MPKVSSKTRYNGENRKPITVRVMESNSVKHGKQNIIKHVIIVNNTNALRK